MYGWSGGFGDTTNCPGPGCVVGNWDDVAGYPVAGVDYDPALLGAPQGPPSNPGYSNTPYTPLTSGQSATQFLNVNAGKIALGVGGFFALMLFAKAGR